MTSLLQQITAYLRRLLDRRAEPRPIDVADRLPAFLAARYRFAEVALRGADVLLMLDERADPEPPARIRTHVDQVRSRTGLPTVYVQPHLGAVRRTRLIEQGVPFVVPGTQMFLPDLGIDLRERFRAAPARRERLRPATQAVWLHLLLSKVSEPVTASRLAPEFGYTAMTIGRAFDELEAHGLVECEQRGRERLLRLPRARRAAWEGSLELLGDPVQARWFVRSPIGAGHLRAGLDALASRSRLVAPESAVVAVGRADWKRLDGLPGESVSSEPDPDATEVQVWRYPPRSQAGDGMVEPLSLYLSLRETADERVEQALDEMLDGIEW